MKKKTIVGLTLLLAAIILVACGPQGSAQYGNPQLLVDTAWLAEHLNDANVRVIDLRPADMYAAGHVPNAVNLKVANVRATVDGVRGQVAPPETVEAVMSSLGVGPDTIVVAYDHIGGLDAARLFWTLEYYGHPDTRLVNGGWVRWEAEGRPVTTEVLQVAPAEFKAKSPNDSLIADAQWIVNRLNDEGVGLVDARSRDEYAGKTVQSARGGHIPGAVNVEWADNLNEDWSFKSAADLQKMYERVGITPDEEVVTYCQTGHRASHSYFTLRLMGYPQVRLYDGSWEEWGNREDLPTERG